jgi:hypothetical protein
LDVDQFWLGASPRNLFEQDCVASRGKLEKESSLCGRNFLLDTVRQGILGKKGGRKARGRTPSVGFLAAILTPRRWKKKDVARDGPWVRGSVGRRLTMVWDTFEGGIGTWGDTKRAWFLR